MQQNLFKNDNNVDYLEDLFQAYFDCRKNKRNTINALKFEQHFEAEIFRLHDELISEQYEPKRSIAFIVNKPVQREIFAADFRDRVVHHFIIGKLNALFEHQFIKDSYACQVRKGTHFGIRRIAEFIKECSAEYTRDCYILKLDIQGFFMHINKNILYERLSHFIQEKYHETDKILILELCRKVIFNDAAGNCIIKGKSSDWKDLPKNKSLFYSPPNCGLPIGNLTSQVFANFYMDKFDHFVKHDLGIKNYGRYVDDFIIVHEDKSYLKDLISTLGNFLDKELHLTLHPKKISLQHYSKGVPFLGTIIKPGRIYIGNRTKGNFYQAIQKQNSIIKTSKPTKEEQLAFQSSMNSYLGIMKHYNTYKLRKKMLWKNLSPYWWNHAYMSGGYAKFVLKIRKAKSFMCYHRLLC
jgi:RNA-directed DNA polymerase